MKVKYKGKVYEAEKTPVGIVSVVGNIYFGRDVDNLINAEVVPEVSEDAPSDKL